MNLNLISKAAPKLILKYGECLEVKGIEIITLAIWQSLTYILHLVQYQIILVNRHSNIRYQVVRAELPQITFKVSFHHRPHEIYA